VWLTRKGAIRARVGDMGVIPGSMGAASYIVEGLGNDASFHSCSHGAGRRMSRGQARRELDVETLNAAMAGKTWNDRDAASLIDEDPRAYKDIDTVMRDQADLVRVVHTLRQVLNYKGVEAPRRKKGKG
jgi:RNA-splicing ligase RtcB